VVTGATAGVGQALTKILYSKNAKIYLATRSASKTAGVISAIKAAFPNSTGSLMHLQLDLNDLAAVKSAADELLATEPHIDVLWNNAGVMMAPIGQTAQGHEIHLGVNCLAHFLFAKLLTPLLRQTAETKEPGSVRVVWLSSIVSDYLMPRGGVPLGNLDFQAPMYQWQKYGVSKAGNYYLATEYARRHGLDGIVSMVRPAVYVLQHTSSFLSKQVSPSTPAISQRTSTTIAGWGNVSCASSAMRPNSGPTRNCLRVCIRRLHWRRAGSGLCPGDGLALFGRISLTVRRAWRRAGLALQRNSGSGAKSRFSSLCERLVVCEISGVIILELVRIISIKAHFKYCRLQP
jgi:NAD(P)-dependent dehydrogenase (short-subunit alcohol dehydrogenase family)